MFLACLDMSVVRFLWSLTVELNPTQFTMVPVFFCHVVFMQATLLMSYQIAPQNVRTTFAVDARMCFICVFFTLLFSDSFRTRFASFMPPKMVMVRFRDKTTRFAGSHVNILLFECFLKICPAFQSRHPRRDLLLKLACILFQLFFIRKYWIFHF